MWIPQLFGQMVAGSFFQALFFLTLCFAALSSLIAMVELVTRVMMDYGFNRGKAVLVTGGGGFLCGLPSALSTDFLNNQDWVWGLGLLLNGFLFTVVVWKFGVSRFRKEVTHIGSAGRKWAWFEYLFFIVIPLEFFFMMGWWFWKAITVYDPHGWWNPFHTYSLGTCLFQWGVVLLLLLGINRYWLRKKKQ
jgi:NSS family neurotransmitter:Na+ symporter